MRCWIARLLIMILCLTNGPAFAEKSCALTSSAWQQHMDEYTDARFRARNVVGGAVVIALNGEVLYARAYGYKNAGKTELVTLDTCFRIASVTKLVSAVGLMQLIETRGIPLDTPVKDIVGFRVVNPSFPEIPITIRQVLSHTSGLKQTQYYFTCWDTMTRHAPYFSQTESPWYSI